MAFEPAEQFRKLFPGALFPLTEKATDNQSKAPLTVLKPF